MRFLSTRGGAPEASLEEALRQGLAPDGGLYFPTRLEPVSQAFLDSLPTRDQGEIAHGLAEHLLGEDLDSATLEHIVTESLSFPVPLVEIDEGVHCLELFWGPTLAFKDVGARFMAQLMLHFCTADEDLTILVATSGDMLAMLLGAGATWRLRSRPLEDRT